MKRVMKYRRFFLVLSLMFMGFTWAQLAHGVTSTVTMSTGPSSATTTGMPPVSEMGMDTQSIALIAVLVLGAALLVGYRVRSSKQPK